VRQEAAVCPDRLLTPGAPDRRFVAKTALLLYRERRPLDEKEESMNPDDLMYTEEHLWVELKGSQARFGITDHAQKELEDIVFVDLPEEGKKVTKGDVVCTIESVKATNDLSCPFSGEVLEANNSLRDKPETINQDPFGAGWLFTLRVDDPADTKGLLDHGAYQKLITS
jgi:glycine cleavage system H protein